MSILNLKTFYFCKGCLSRRNLSLTDEKLRSTKTPGMWINISTSLGIGHPQSPQKLDFFEFAKKTFLVKEFV